MDQTGQTEEVPGPALFCSNSASAHLDGVAVRKRTSLKIFTEMSPYSLSTRHSVGPTRVYEASGNAHASGTIGSANGKNSGAGVPPVSSRLGQPKSSLENLNCGSRYPLPS